MPPESIRSQTRSRPSDPRDFPSLSPRSAPLLPSETVAPFGCAQSWGSIITRSPGPLILSASRPSPTRGARGALPCKPYAPCGRAKRPTASRRSLAHVGPVALTSRTMPEDTLNVLDGSTFVVGDRHGDLTAGPGLDHGFFSEDTRFLSHWSLRVDGSRLEPLGVTQDQHFAAQFFLAPHVPLDDEAPYSVIRRRCVDRAWLEELTILGHRREGRAGEIEVQVDIDTDFADLFEVKNGDVGRRQIDWCATESGLVLTYANGPFRRSVSIDCDQPSEVSRRSLRFRCNLDRGEQWTAAFRITPSSSQPGTRSHSRAVRGSLSDVQRAKAAEQERWLAGAPVLETEDPALAKTYRASLTDLSALRLQADLDARDTLPAAGLPWFMALFGRDSLISSFQSLPYLPALAASTLRGLAARQALTRDDFHDQEPGKIPHELRLGELTVSGRQPHAPYYGTADATPLFVILLDEYHRWTGDDALVRELEPAARSALAWLDTEGDADGDGYVEYERRNLDTGLINQCWKDSWDSIQFADGTLARGPIATCEIQGYAYDARRRGARLARTIWRDPDYANRLEGLAAVLRARWSRR